MKTSKNPLNPDIVRLLVDDIYDRPAAQLRSLDLTYVWPNHIVRRWCEWVEQKGKRPWVCIVGQ